MAYKIAFYDTKPYDERSFTEANEKFGFDIKFYKGHLNMNNVVLTKGVDVVCIFVNDTADAEVIRAMADNGVKLLALRCAGYNNVDLAATAGKMKVVRVQRAQTNLGYATITSIHPMPLPNLRWH